MPIRKAKDLTESGWYWWRANPAMNWDVMHIRDPQRLSYAIDAVEFVGPLTPPPSR
ncbi:hypothetical protein [Jeongeupia sp. USM3]|uniref:hypothetical protein n=1 Tax=Jeongeupia sp. USM3 TaxID=1906741 RepID=UPI00143B6574|nr:hypothetical protein [Jeongeupia sp. USM3]